MQHCDECNKDFYSDTEFEMHQQMDVVKGAVAASRKTGEALNNLCYEMEVRAVLELMIAKNTSFEQATEMFLTYRAQYGPLANAHNIKTKEAWEKKHGVG